MDQVAVEIPRDLDLDMARLLDHLLDINLARMESSFSLACSIADRRLKLTLRVHTPHPLAAPTRRRLQQHRISELASQLARMLQMRRRFLAARHHRNIHLLGQNPCRRFRSQPDRKSTRLNSS